MQYFLIQISVRAKSRDPVQRRDCSRRSFGGKFAALYRRDGGLGHDNRATVLIPRQDHDSTIDPAIIDSHI